MSPNKPRIKPVFFFPRKSSLVSGAAVGEVVGNEKEKAIKSERSSLA